MRNDGWPAGGQSRVPDNSFTLLSEYLDVQKERDEALAEIARHHRDFERIRALLDEDDTACQVTRPGEIGGVHRRIIRGIRSIVG